MTTHVAIHSGTAKNPGVGLFTIVGYHLLSFEIYVGGLVEGYYFISNNTHDVVDRLFVSSFQPVRMIIPDHTT